MFEKESLFPPKIKRSVQGEGDGKQFTSQVILFLHLQMFLQQFVMASLPEHH